MVIFHKGVGEIYSHTKGRVINYKGVWVAFYEEGWTWGKAKDEMNYWSSLKKEDQKLIVPLEFC
jgi:hypothetical protein